MTAGTALGAAALAFALAAALAPGAHWAGWLGLFLAALAALRGERGFVVATLMVSLATFLFLSPLVWQALAAASAGHGPGPAAALTLAAFLAPVAAMARDVAGRRGDAPPDRRLSGGG